MEIPFAKWYPAIEIRRSRRQYDGRLLEPDLLEQLRTVCNEFKPFPSARAVLVTDSPKKVFKGAVGQYGKIKEAPAFIAFIGNMENPCVQEQVGYTGEGIILEATALGLATCWVGGFFRPEVAAFLAGTLKNEKVLSVTPVGYAAENDSLEERVMSGFGRHSNRKPLSEIVTGLREDRWQDWMRTTLEAARLAPSAVNRQPWMFRLQPDSITVWTSGSKVDFGISRRLDCGIAMLHIEVAALSCGIKGSWEFLEAPQVARFRVI